MDWVLGPVKYATLSNSLLVPFMCYETQGTSYVDLQPVAIMEKCTDVNKAMQGLVNIAASYVKRHPGQWLHWNRLPEMLSRSE